jgi:thiol-disulfide isomerase/thioredoxin
MSNKIVIWIIVAVIVIAGAVFFASQTSNNQTASETEKAAMQNAEKMDGTSMEQESTMKDEAMMENDASPKDETTMKGEAMMEPAGQEPKDTMTKPGSYKDYSPETVANEQKAGNKVVLFFHAPWCPFCKAADAAFKEKVGQIPSGVTVLKTDYDSNTDLKKKYGVTYQHTFVQIDTNGNMVTKWNGGDIDNLKKYLK